MKLRALLLVIVVLVTACDSNKTNAALTYKRVPLSIITQNNKTHNFTVELALQQNQREFGLMFRRTLGDNAGMLFIFDNPEIIQMWMRNTSIALDMLFINNKGEIVDIARNTIPFSLDIIASRVPASIVLEVKAGTAERLKLNVGDRIVCAGYVPKEAGQ
jgi:uncharacterized protein